MSHPLLRPLFLNEAEITASTEELLAQDFVTELGVTQDNPDNNSDDLKLSVKNAMTAADFSPDEIKELLDYLFDSANKELFSPFSIKANDNARRFGFSSITSLQAAATEETFNRKLRCYEFSLSASTLAGLLRASPLLLTDEPAHYYRSLLAKFCRRSSRPSLHPRIEQIVAKSRQNAVKLLTRQPESCSLNRLAHQEITLHRYSPRRKVSLILNTKDKQPLHLDQLSVFNCFLCPATVEEGTSPANIHESLAAFARDDPTIPHINYKRLLPYDGAKAVLHHVHDQHLQICKEDDACSLVIPCKTCIQQHMIKPDQNPLDAAFVCCAKCGLDHSLILHSASDRLLALYSSLEADFRYNTAAKLHLEHFLFTRCFICGGLFKTKEEMELHQLNCISSFSCLSSGFGRPLASEIFYTNSFIKAKEDEQCLSHASNQLAKLVQALQISMPSPEDHLTQRAACALSSLAASTSSPQNPAMVDRKKGKAGKRGDSKSSKTLTMPPGLDSSEDDYDNDDDNEGVQPTAPPRDLTNPQSTMTIHPPANIDGTFNTSERNNRDLEEYIWMEADQMRIALLESMDKEVDCDPAADYDDDTECASTVLKQEQTYDASCAPPPAKKKQTL